MNDAPTRLDPPAVTVVTGAGGWLGTALMHAIVTGAWQRPGTVRPLVRDRVEADELRALGPSVDPVVGDLRDTGTLDRLFDGLDGVVDVIHAAGVIHPGSVAEFFETNTDATRSMLSRSKTAGVRRFVHVSSNSPFGTNAHPGDRFRDDEPYHPYYGYGRSKMDAELAVFEAVEAGHHAVIVRPPWFYGPHQPARQTTFFQLVRRGRFPVFGDGSQVRSMVYVDNLVQGVMLAELSVAAPGSAWWIADARPYTVREIVDTVGAALRDEGFEVSASRVRLPDIVGRTAEYADALIQRTGRYVQQVHVLGEMNKHIAVDIGGARAELGYDPQVELHEGMRRSIRWCVGQGYEL